MTTFSICEIALHLSLFDSTSINSTCLVVTNSWAFLRRVSSGGTNLEICEK